MRENAHPVINFIKTKKIATYIIVFLIGVSVSVMIDSIRFTKYIEPKMTVMEPIDAYNKMNEKPGSYLFYDVRTLNEYNLRHAKFSENLPIAYLYDKWNILPRKDKTIYLICNGGKLSAVAYGYLQLHGFRNIVQIKGGIQNWALQGLPTLSAEKNN